jgi:glutamine amidotransferase
VRIAVVDYGMGNLRSVSKALERVAPKAEVVVSADPDMIRSAERVVVPGQGALPDCMRCIAETGAREALIEALREKPYLGICLGLQMLFQRGEEGNTAGLGVLAGDVPRFSDRTLKVPHMGWNEVLQAKPHPLWQGISDRSRFYFVHSYYPAPREDSLIAARALYGAPFTCAVARDNIFAVQFHPEKSHDAGEGLLRNFLYL